MNETPKLDYITEKIAVITFQRSDKANRLEAEDLVVLEGFLKSLTAQVLIIKSEGKHFCSGFDLSALEGGKENRFPIFTKLLANLPVLTVALVQGTVAGGATDIVLACDIAIASENAQLFMPASKLGVPLYKGALERYVSRLGLQKAKRLIFMAETLKASALLDIGFVSEVVTLEQLELRGLALAYELSQRPTAPILAMKQGLNEAAFGVICEATHLKLEQAFDLEETKRLVAGLKK